jgi:methylated-DNA-[protein]-cysteine S-methyltransferase
MSATVFQKAVWKEVSRVPRGQTITYAELAERIGKPGAARAVGNALNKNPLPLIVPCHRVVPSNGETGGYAFGRTLKKLLLLLERI